MKIISVLLMVFLCMSGVYAAEQHVSFSVNEQPLKDTVKMICDVAGYNYAVDAGVTYSKITAELKNMPVKKALQIVCAVSDTMPVFKGNTVIILPKTDKHIKQINKHKAAALKQKKIKQQKQIREKMKNAQIIKKKKMAAAQKRYSHIPSLKTILAKKRHEIMKNMNYKPSKAGNQYRWEKYGDLYKKRGYFKKQWNKNKAHRDHQHKQEFKHTCEEHCNGECQDVCKENCHNKKPVKKQKNIRQHRQVKRAEHTCEACEQNCGDAHHKKQFKQQKNSRKHHSKRMYKNKKNAYKHKKYAYKKQNFNKKQNKNKTRFSKKMKTYKKQQQKKLKNKDQIIKKLQKKIKKLQKTIKKLKAAKKKTAQRRIRKQRTARKHPKKNMNMHWVEKKNDGYEYIVEEDVKKIGDKEIRTIKKYKKRSPRNRQKFYSQKWKEPKNMWQKKWKKNVKIDPDKVHLVYIMSEKKAKVKYEEKYFVITEGKNIPYCNVKVVDIDPAKKRMILFYKDTYLRKEYKLK